MGGDGLVERPKSPFFSLSLLLMRSESDGLIWSSFRCYMEWAQYFFSLSLCLVNFQPVYRTFGFVEVSPGSSTASDWLLLNPAEH